MTDVIIENGKCVGVKAENENGTYEIYAENTILASGGIGGTYQHSTNFPHLTGDAIEIAKKTQYSSGTSGLCTDSSNDIIFEETGKTFPDLRVCTWRRCGSL